jgi:tape measure domain-containing protein
VADQTSRLKIIADISGLDGLEKLKGAFRGLQQSVGPTDQVIRRARQEINDFVAAGVRSEQAIQGQISAFRALQSQAKIGSETYEQLGNDIRQLQNNLREVQAEFQGVNTQAQTLARTLNQGIGNSASKVAGQLSILRENLNTLKIGGQEYINVLQRIREIETVNNARSARSNVIAGNQAYSSATLTTGYGADANLPQMPDTTAALNQRLNELTVAYANVGRGGERYIQIAREISAIQRQLAQDFRAQTEPMAQANARLAQTRAGIAASGFGAFSTGIEDNIAVQKSIARNARKNPVIPDGPLADQPQQASSLWQSVAVAQNAKLANSNQMMGRTYGEVASAIRSAKDTSDGSIRSLQAQRDAWTQLSAAVQKGSKEYRDAQTQIKAVDKQIGTGNRLENAAKIGGTVAAGAIFGGPEGAIGGLIGAGFGGVAGAALGTEIGATAGMVRQSISATAEYAATIDKLNIALKGVAGSQAEYARAQEAINSSSTRFNVPLDNATQNFTRLAASVKGAGGNITNAKIVFDGITSAIKATGGSTEDADAAILAMSQVFSKGKVSAEELQGQLGERLPGAVTEFAKATGRTLPQLQKDLKDGTVGLNDVMKFAISMQEKYGTAADKMAKSTESAGERMKVALDKLKYTFGEFFKPVGAGFQELTAKVANFLSGQLDGTAKNQIPIFKLFQFLAGRGNKETKETTATSNEPPQTAATFNTPGKTPEEIAKENEKTAAKELHQIIKSITLAQQEYNTQLRISNDNFKALNASADYYKQQVSTTNQLKEATLNADLAVNNAAKSILQSLLEQATSEKDKIAIKLQIRQIDIENAKIQRDIAVQKIQLEQTLANLAATNAQNAYKYSQAESTRSQALVAQANAAVAQAQAAYEAGGKTTALLQLLQTAQNTQLNVSQTANAAQNKVVEAGYEVKKTQLTAKTTALIGAQQLRAANAQFNATNYLANQFPGLPNGAIPTGEYFNGAPVVVINGQRRTGQMVNGVVRYAGGGYTGDGPRSGGLDGQGGFIAMLHPRETVIDHTRTGGTAPSITIQTGQVVQMPDGSQWVSMADLEQAMRATAAGVLGQLRTPAGRVAMGGA